MLCPYYNALYNIKIDECLTVTVGSVLSLKRYMYFSCVQVMSQRSQYATFFFQLADLGCSLLHSQLRDGARNLLQLVPPDTFTVTRLQWLFGHYKDDEALQIASHCNEQNTTVDSLFFTASPSQVLYNLEVNARACVGVEIHANLKPVPLVHRT